MTITDVKIRGLYQEERLKAVASVTFDNELVVHDIKIIQTSTRLIAAMPSRKDTTGTGRIYRDIAHPINIETRKKIEDAVFAAYQEAVEAIKDSQEKDNQEA